MRQDRRMRSGNQSGMTFLEIMAVTAISSIVLAAILVVFNAGRSAYDTTEAKLTIREETRKALDAIGRDLREAKLTSYCLDGAGGTGCTGGYTLILRFQRPSLSNPSCAPSFYNPDTGAFCWDTVNDVAYEWAKGAAPTSLFRCSPSTATPCQTLALRVNQLTLAVFDANGTPLTPPTPPAALDLTTTNAPATVLVSVAIAPAQTTTSGQLTPYTSNDQITLRNPQR